MIDRLGTQADNVIMVGDSDNDICLMKAAGRSVAFRPKSAAVAAAARFSIHQSLTEVLDILDNETIAWGSTIAPMPSPKLNQHQIH